MSDLIKKCRKDGTEFGASFTGACPICGEAVTNYCRKHQEWLTGPACPRCSLPPAPKTTASEPRVSADVVFVVGALVLMAALVVLIIFAARHYFTKPPKPAPRIATVTTPKPAPPKPPPPTPPPPVPPAPRSAPVFPTYPPTRLSLAELLRDPDRFDGKLVQVTGNAQFIETGKATFDLRDVNRTLPVLYQYASAQSKGNVAPNARVAVTGLLQRLNQEDAWQIVAQTIETP